MSGSISGEAQCQANEEKHAEEEDEKEDKVPDDQPERAHVGCEVVPQIDEEARTELQLIPKSLVQVVIEAAPQVPLVHLMVVSAELVQSMRTGVCYTPR